MRSVKVSSAQIRIIAGDLAGNLNRASEAVLEAKNLGADFVVLPECSNFGWTDLSAKTEAVEIEQDPLVNQMRLLASELSIYIAVGFVERVGSQLFNSSVLIDAQGSVIIHHRKINELDFAQELYSTGSEVSVAKTPFGIVGLMICADALSQTDKVIERLMVKGAEFILSPSAWAVPPSHDNVLEPYGSLWIDAYRRGLGAGKSWIVATSNVGVIQTGAWGGHLCIGNSIAIGPNESDLFISPYGVDAVHTKLVVLTLPN
jgi:predicted amidohydrolase